MVRSSFKVYALRYRHCGNKYDANGYDVQLRWCPRSSAPTLGTSQFFIFLGFAGALREIVRGTIGSAATQGTEQYARLLEAVADLIRALTAAPQWLALVAVGVILIVMGAVFAFPGEVPLSIVDGMG